MKDLTQNPDLRKREVVDDYFGDWKWREGLSELMIPIIGNLYRNGIQIYIYGQSLVNNSSIEILKAHRFVRQVEGNELSELETYPILVAITSFDLPDCEIDIGELAVRCPFFDKLKDNPQDKVNEYVLSELNSIVNKSSNRPKAPKEIVLYGAYKIGTIVSCSSFFAKLFSNTSGPIPLRSPIEKPTLILRVGFFILKSNVLFLSIYCPVFSSISYDK